MIHKGDYLRYLYRGGRPHRWARIQNGWGAWLAAHAVGPSAMVALEVVGRTSGRTITMPLAAVDLGGQTYLVAMLGERTSWVANVRAAGNRAVLVRRGRRAVHLEDVPVAERAPVLRRYLDLAPGGRPHIRVDRRASREEFDRVAGDYPVFRVVDVEPGAEG
jgi:deazaflavin-dependent oxidoreductase (nitroreductase family)